MKDVVIIAGKIRVDPAKRDQVLVDGAQLMVDTRTQKGCLDYVWSADPTDPARIYVFERWECIADLAAHLKGEFYLRMRDHMGTAGLTEAETLKYRIDWYEQVYDETMTPRADFFTAPD
jgi:quinol monooxygenase YgiN